MSRLIVVGCILVLLLAFFGSVIFQANAPIFRDAAHFYYPLFKLVQQEWAAGRVPLWNPYENSGHPLAGNPTASVFYPLKVLFFLPVPYPAAYKVYILVHVLLCAATAYAMARHWGGSIGAGGICAISYAFCGVVVFQYANVVFLCGAAWIPLALIAADRALRLGQWRWVAGLGVVLAMQVLGGDPQSAYVCGLLAAWYAAMLWWRLKRSERASEVAGPDAARDSIAAKPRRLRMLAAAAFTMAALSAIQLVPSWQFSRRSVRAYHAVPRNVYQLVATAVRQRRFEYAGLFGHSGRTPHQIYEFSTGPWRWPEFLWPNVTGRQFPVNTRWIHALADETTVWVPSLYMGLVPLVLGLSAWRFRTAPARQALLQWTCLLGVIGALGRFGIVWLLRIAIGDPNLPAARAGGEVGGLYWLLSVALPGFVNFRYPSKLLVFAAVGFSGLAAIGWDGALAGRSRAARHWLVAALAASVLAAVAVWNSQDAVAQWVSKKLNDEQFRARTSDAYYGPLEAEAAWRGALGATLHTSLVAALALGVLIGGGRVLARRPAIGHAALLILAAADLAAANHWLVLTGSQSDHAFTPRAVEIIRRAEAKQNGDQPFRIYRTLLFTPIDWRDRGAPDRPVEGFHWERNTLMAKYGLDYGVHYTLSAGAMSLYEYEFFFGPWYEPSNRPAMVYYPQRGFDYWNTKYFILPWHLSDRQGRSMDMLEHRGIRSFLRDLQGIRVPRVFPTTAEEERVADQLDFQILRNPDFFPRAWIVHRLIPNKPLNAHRRDERDEIEDIMELLLRRGRPDLRREALVEVTDPAILQPFDRPSADDEGEVCRIRRYDPQRVEISVRLNEPGMLVLADTYYPGWEVEVDGVPAAVLRANRMMRGVTLAPGAHDVVFTYRPWVFYGAAWISAVTWSLLLLVGIVRLIRRAAGARPSASSAA